MGRYYRDVTPRLITARYAGVCCGCKAAVKRGDEVLYYPNGKAIECRTCAVPTLGMLDDERSMRARSYEPEGPPEREDYDY